MDINDEKQEKIDAVKAEVAQLNAQAVVAKLQDFETRLDGMTKQLTAFYAKLQALESRLNIQMSLEAMAANRGSGPTSGR